VEHIVNPDGASRRTIIKAGVAAVGLSLTGFGAHRVLAQDATPEGSGTPTTCVLTANVTEGPYYLDGQLIRTDITEGKEGVPVTLQIAVQDITTCAPLANAAVEIWHCDAQGYYSGIIGENPGGGGAATGEDNATTTFLRGIQLTDDTGIVMFDTIFPGWYVSRTVHIHMKVHVDGTIVDIAEDEDAVATPEGGETYEGEQTCHVGQLFFTDDLANEVFATDAYARQSDSDRTTNDQDGILGDHDDDPSFMVEVEGSVEDGLVGTITVGVDPTATASEGGTDGSAGGGPPGGNGTPPDGGGPGGPQGTPPSGD
jgi:protocatechuate 3,4-dioxygenase beta subunit